MNSSDEEDVLMLLLLRRRRKRKRQSIWCREHFLLRESRGEFQRTFSHLLENPDEELFFNYTRMSYSTYNALKSLVLERLKPDHSNWRKSISAEEKLSITLRSLATGASFSSMTVPFHMSRRSITRHIYQTCQVLWDVLQPLELKPPTKDQWFKIATRFGDLWDFPFAVGAIDGKHIALDAPSNSGSMYYCYKGFPSIVLMAVSDADSCFILVDCGQYGRISDAGVYRTSQISKLLEEGKLNIPTSEFKVNSTERTIPFMIVGDEAFPLKTYLLKPYAAKTLDQEKRIYNYRHSRARRTVECAFGILAKKFEIFQRPLRVEPDKAVLLTNAALVLHNFIRRRDGHMVDRTSDVTYEVVEGQGRGMFPLEAPTHGGRPSAEAMAIRDSVKTFFNAPQGGTVPWQHENVFRNVIANEID